jgi:hypothetical protein
MALLWGDSTLRPTKDQLIDPWVRTRPWWDGQDERGPVGSFRLDDPAGEVGMQGFLLGSPAGSTLFVPLTFRAAPLEGAEEHLVGTLEHSVLGTRWVYDGAGDPVLVATLLDTIRDGATEAQQLVRRDDGSESVREPDTTVRGSGDPVPAHDPDIPVVVEELADRTVVRAGEVTLTVMRRLGEAPTGPALRGSYEGGDDIVLAVVS